MKTRILSLLLVLVMAVGMLASCGGGGGGTTDCTHADANHDQKCDTCGADVPCTHKIDPLTGFCDWCTYSECISHVDDDHDQKCDKCQAAVACTVHADANVDNKCDWCGAAYSCSLLAKGGHADEDQDGLCDECSYVTYDKEFDWDSATLTFEMTDNSNGQELGSGCRQWMAGEAGEKTSLTQIAAADRNKMAEQITKVAVTYSFCPDNGEYNWSKNFSRILNEMEKNQSKDMYCNFVYDLIGAYLNACFANLKTSQYTNYFEFAGDDDYGTTVKDSNGYMYEYMTSLSIKEDKMYLLASDYFIDLVRAFYVVPVNVMMLGELDAADLAKTPKDFAAMVSRGEWTYEMLAKYCALYGGESSVNSDKKGFAVAEHSLSAAGLLYTTSVRLLTDARRVPGNSFVDDGTNSPYSYADTNETLGAFATALDNLMTKPGVVRFTKQDAGTAGSNLLAIREQFVTHRVLFGGVIMLGSLEYKNYQDMKTTGEGFLVVPVPLYTAYNKDTNDVYSTQVHNIGRIGAISTRTTKFAECSAFLDFQSTHSRVVRDTYYEKELLLSVVGGGGTDAALMEANKEMLALLRQSLVTGFDKAYEDSAALYDNGTLITTPDDGEKTFVNLKWHDIFDRKHYQMSATITPYYNTLKSAKETAMKNLFLNGNTQLPN